MKRILGLCLIAAIFSACAPRIPDAAGPFSGAPEEEEVVETPLPETMNTPSAAVGTLEGGGKDEMNSLNLPGTVEPISADEMNRSMGKGVNLGDALDAPNEGEWGVFLKAEYFQLIKEAGFQTVRIPARFSGHALEEEPYTLSPAFLERTDWAIAEALKNDLIVIIDMHHYVEMAEDPDAHAGRVVALWQQIAEHYKDYPQELVFELFNEPNSQLDARRWNALIARILPVVRASNPERNVIIGGAMWNGFSELERLKLPEDDRHIILTFHYYLPFEFTHQGAEWAQGSEAWLGTSWDGRQDEIQAIAGHFDAAAEAGRAMDRPIFVGEFGAYSKAHIDSRARWTAEVVRQAEQRGMSWAYWEFCAGFGIYDKDMQIWVKPLVQALLGP
jgi:endoglucanase